MGIPEVKKKERVNLNNGMMFHFYADDSQIYFSFDSNTPELVTASRLGACVKDVSDWMSANKIFKTEL